MHCISYGYGGYPGYGAYEHQTRSDLCFQAKETQFA